jgi:hypothetical protein
VERKNEPKLARCRQLGSSDRVARWNYNLASRARKGTDFAGRAACADSTRAATALRLQSVHVALRGGLYNLDLLSEALGARSLAMWYSHFQKFFERLEGLDFHQLSLLVLAIVAFGFYCLRGFGSRSDY